MTRNILTLAFLLITSAVAFSQNSPQLMGITSKGGSSNTGTIFSLSPDGKDFTLQHNFDEVGPHTVYAGLTLGSDGKFYGVTYDGGTAKSGSVYKVEANGSNFEVLHSFTINDGAGPRSAPIEGSDGNLYGTTTLGGDQSAGLIYSLDKNGGNFSVLHHFNGADGEMPIGALHESTDGFLYGMANQGGAYGDGTVYKIAKDGSGFSMLYSFLGIEDGRNPFGGFIEDSNGSLYGTLYTGGPDLAGSVFKIQKDGTGLQLLKTFNFDPNDGNEPYGTLLEASDGKLYGTTFSGGASYVGIVFSMDKNGGNYSILHEFNNIQGRNPFAGNQLEEGADGALYGTTQRGGTYENGVVYKINKNGTGFTVIHEFDGTGAKPYAGVTASNGQLYGTTSEGGNSNGGTLFSIAEDGSGFTELVDFSKTNVNGYFPTALPSLASDGWVYGSTQEGGDHGFGSLFRLKADGTYFETIYHFDGQSGASPSSSLLVGSDGMIYGTATYKGEFNNGTIFKIDPSNSAFSLLHTFSIVGELGALPQAGLIEGSDGKLYGATQSGGNTGAGTIFRLDKDGSNLEAIYHFVSNGNTGRAPRYNLLEGNDQLLYGVTVFGGSSSSDEEGTLFRLKKDGSNFEVLKNFNQTANGTPAGPLVSNHDGFLYGMTINGGNNLVGTIYRISTDGQTFETIHHLDVINGISPQGSLMSSPTGDWLYGVTKAGGEFDQGVVFRIKPDGSAFEKIHDFKGYANGGAEPNGGLVWVSQASGNVEKDRLSGLSVVPNPTDGPITLIWENEFSIDKKATLNIYDESGKLLGNKTGDFVQLNAYLSGQSNSWNNGIYFLSIETNNGYFSKKIIVNKY